MDIDILMALQNFRNGPGAFLAGFFSKMTWLGELNTALVIMALIAFHMTAFSYKAGGAVRLHWFGGGQLAAQLLLVAALAVHIIANARPMLISFGVRKLKPRVGDILFIMSALLLIMAAAFIVYYLRWNGQ